MTNTKNLSIQEHFKLSKNIDKQAGAEVGQAQKWLGLEYDARIATAQT